jgi:hypothetical protein
VKILAFQKEEAGERRNICVIVRFARAIRTIDVDFRSRAPNNVRRLPIAPTGASA